MSVWKMAAVALLSAACAARTAETPLPGPEPVADPREIMSSIADRYVSLVLALGVHDADYVDAYYGPPEKRADAEALKLPLPQIREAATSLRAALQAVPRSEEHTSEL